MINGGEGGDDNHDDGHDDGSGEVHHASAYENPDPTPPDRFSFDVPDPNAPDYFDKIGPVMERLGRPKLSSGYRWQDDHPEFGPLSEEDKGYRSHMAQVFWRTGMTQPQASELERAQVQYLKTLRDGRAAKLADADRRLQAELKKSWNSGYDAKMKAANLALRGLAGDRDAKALASLELADGTRLSHNAAFVRMMAAAGEASPTSVKAAGGTPEAAEQEIKKIQNEAMKRGLDPTSKSWPHAELDRHKGAYGTKQIDQSIQRGEERE